MLRNRLLGTLEDGATEEIVARTSYVSGTIDSTDTVEKRIFVCDRLTMKILGTTVVNGGDWKIRVPAGIVPESIIVLGFDESGDYNLDGYDKASACVEQFSVTSESNFSFPVGSGRSFIGTDLEQGVYPDRANETLTGTKATTFTDDFTGTDGDAPDAVKWEVLNYGDKIITQITSNTLHCEVITGAQADVFSQIQSNGKLTGKFDVQLNWLNLVDSGSNSQNKLVQLIAGITPWQKAFGLSYVSISILSDSSGLIYIVEHMVHGTSTVNKYRAVSGTSGKIRICRGVNPSDGTDSANSVDLFLSVQDDDSGTSWDILETTGFYRGDVNICMGCFPATGKACSCDIDSVTVNRADGVNAPVVFTEDFHRADAEIIDSDLWRVVGRPQHIKNNKLNGWTALTTIDDFINGLELKARLSGDVRVTALTPLKSSNIDPYTQHANRLVLGASSEINLQLHAQYNTLSSYYRYIYRTFKSVFDLLEPTNIGQQIISGSSNNSNGFQLASGESVSLGLFLDNYNSKWDFIPSSSDFATFGAPSYMALLFINKDAPLTGFDKKNECSLIRIQAENISVREFASPVVDDCSGTLDDLPAFDFWMNDIPKNGKAVQGWRVNNANQYQITVPAGEEQSLFSTLSFGGAFSVEIDFTLTIPSPAVSTTKFYIGLLSSNFRSYEPGGDQDFGLTLVNDVGGSVVTVNNNYGKAVGKTQYGFQENVKGQTHVTDGTVAGWYVSINASNNYKYLQNSTYLAIDLERAVTIRSIITACYGTSQTQTDALKACTLWGSNDSTDGIDGTWTQVGDFSSAVRKTDGMWSYYAASTWVTAPIILNNPGSYQWYKIKDITNDTKLNQVRLFEGLFVDDTAEYTYTPDKVRLSRTATDIKWEVFDTAWHTLRTDPAAGFPDAVEAVKLMLTNDTPSDSLKCVLNSVSITADWIHRWGNADMGRDYSNNGLLYLAAPAVWMSPEISLDEYDTIIQSSKVWEHTMIDTRVPENDREKIVKTEVTFDGGSTWAECTHDKAIPGITAGMSTTGVVMQFRVTKYAYRGFAFTGLSYNFYVE